MISMYFGVPGCGKSTVLTALARKELRRIEKGKSKYSHVLTNFFVDGCEKIDFSDIGIFDIQDSLILLDEVTVDADNRDFKNFKKSSVEGFVYHRHYNNDIIMATQQYDAVDKKIRNLTQYLWQVNKSYLLPFVKCKRIFRIVDIDENSHDLVLGYRFANFKEILISMFFPRKIGAICKRFFAPFYWKYFDSHCKPLNLKDYNFIEWRSFNNE